MLPANTILYGPGATLGRDSALLHMKLVWRDSTDDHGDCVSVLARQDMDISAIFDCFLEELELLLKVGQLALVHFVLPILPGGLETVLA